MDNDGIFAYEDCNDGDAGTLNDMDCDGFFQRMTAMILIRLW